MRAGYLSSGVFLFSSALMVGVPRTAAAAETRPRAMLAGIFRTGDAPARKMESIEAEVTQRLEILGLEVVQPRATSEPCKAAECLRELAEKAGAVLAITGVVYRTADLCTANLWVFDTRSGTGRAADIHCQPNLAEDSLGMEFADQVGRLSEEHIAEPSLKPTFSTVSILPSKAREQSFRPLWQWDWRRKAAAYSLGLTLTGLIGTSITLTSFRTLIKNPDQEIANLVIAGWTLTAVNAVAFGATFAIPTIRR